MRIGQGGCERRIEVFEKIQKKKIFFFFFFWGGGGVGSGWGGGQGSCERRSEGFVKIQKMGGSGGRVGGVWDVGSGGGSGWGEEVSVYVNEEMKIL